MMESLQASASMMRFDASEHLGRVDIQAELLSEALATGKARVIAHALGMIARARGMSDIARTAGLSRGSLYAALDEEGNPSLDTVMRVLKALELELRAETERRLDAGLRRKLAASVELVNWLDDQYSDLEYPAGTANLMAYACIAVVFAHHRAVITLLQADLFAPAFALIRSQMDSYARGMWLRYRATEEEVENVKAGGDPPKTERIIKALEGGGVLDPGILSGIWSEIWGTLCDYAHTGIRQMQRQFTSEEVAPNCDVADKMEALNMADSWALVAAGSILEMGGYHDRAKVVVERFKTHI